MVRSTVMEPLLARIARAVSAERDPLVVLDLDGTLYNNAPRTLRILLEFAHVHAVEHPGLLARVDRLPAGAVSYRVADTLAALGVDDPAVVEQVQRFWRERFFTDAYVLQDLPTAGAVELVRRLHAAGAVPCYLTGRDAPNMLVGTVQTLQRDGFPVGTVDTRLILKDDFATPDADYKRSVIRHLQATGTVVGVFENEPGLCNLFRAAFPDAVVAWLDTSHGPDAPPLDPGIAGLTDFRMLLD